MLKLMRLEIKRNRLNTYVNSSMIACILLVGFIYFVSYVAQVQKEPDFQSYPNIFLFTSIVSMIVFCIQSAVMYSRFVIEEYSGTRLLLLFSYPVNRKKMLLAKISVVVGFTTIAMIVSNILFILIFSITESILPIVEDRISLELLLSCIKTVFVLAVGVNVINIIAMRIGFVKKSIPANIVVSFALCAIFGNLVIGSFGNDILLLILLIVVLAVGAGIILELMKKVNTMEIE